MSKITFEYWLDKVGAFTFKFIFTCALIAFWSGLVYFIWILL